MKLKTVASYQIALFSLASCRVYSLSHGRKMTTVPSEKLAAIFPNAKNFVEKKSDLTPEKVTSIEAEIETNLRPEDLKPTFYIAVNENEKPIGLALL